jgi:hypothetical protein
MAGNKRSSLFGLLISDKKGFMMLTPGTNVIRLLQPKYINAGVYVLGKDFQPSLMFEG